MDEVLSNADIDTLYNKCLFIHEGVLVKVVGISFDTNPPKFTILTLATGKKSIVDFRQEAFKQPERRIGFVNIMRSVVYVVRLPVRKYQLGINAGNIEMRCPPVEYPEGRADAKDKVKNLSCSEIYMAYSNKYPSLDEAYKNAVEWEGACAFDKQFAVGYNSKIFYKELEVGKLKDGKIVFIPAYEYLEIVLEQNYEKASRTFSPRCL